MFSTQYYKCPHRFLEIRTLSLLVADPDCLHTHITSVGVLYNTSPCQAIDDYFFFAGNFESPKAFFYGGLFFEVTNRAFHAFKLVFARTERKSSRLFSE